MSKLVLKLSIIVALFVFGISYAESSNQGYILVRPVGGGNHLVSPTAPQVCMVNNVIHVNYPTIEEATVAIYDSNGYIVAVQNISQHNGEIECDTSNLPKGNYTITIESESSSYEGYFTIN